MPDAREELREIIANVLVAAIRAVDPALVVKTHVARAGVILRWELAPVPPLENRRAGLVALVLANLVQNACEVSRPGATVTVTSANPAHWLDFRRYASDMVVAFNRAQTDILRALSPGRDIMHNYMGFFTEFDHHDVAAAPMMQLGLAVHRLGRSSITLDLACRHDGEERVRMRQVLVTTALEIWSATASPLPARCAGSKRCCWSPIPQRCTSCPAPAI